MKRLVLAVLFAAFAGEAAAQVDPVNWCPDYPSLEPPPFREALQQAFHVSAEGLVERASPGDRIATLSLQPISRRPIQSPRSELGFAEGALLTPMWVVGRNADVLSQLGHLYCGPSSLGDALSNGVCVGEVNAETGIARSALHARLAEPREAAGLHAGALQIRRDRPLGRMQDWGTMGPEAPEGQTFSRSLTFERIEVVPQAALFQRPAFSQVRLHFVLEGFAPFVRALNQPIRTEEGWIVATDVAGDSVTFARLSGPEWIALRQERCPAQQ